MPYRIARHIDRQQGAAMVEFAVAALPLLFAALFVIEAARWHTTRQMLNLALLEAARAGATGHGQPSIIEQAFEQALLPLFQPAGRHGSPRARMRADFLDIARQTGTLAWRIDVASPAAPVFADFRDAALRVPAAPGRPAINNDYQAEQHSRRLRMGWPGGRGPLSGQTIFEANTLRLRLRYIHPPLVPGVRALLRSLAAMHGTRDSAANAGMLSIVMEMALPMQSHPVQWQPGDTTARARSPADRGRPWSQPVDDTAGARGAGRRESDPGQGYAPAWRPSSGTQTSTSVAVGHQTVDQHGTSADMKKTLEQEDAACGVVLCCVTPPEKRNQYAGRAGPR